jgi:hypothetical protein
VTEATAEIYDPATGTFGPTGPMVEGRAAHTATKLADGRVLIAGGYTIRQPDGLSVPARAEIFDPATGQFHATGAMTTPRGEHSATLLADGRVLIIGGAHEFGPDGEATSAIPGLEIFDPKTERFSSVAALATDRMDHSATLMTDGRVLIAGGRNDRGDPRSTEIFDPVRGTIAAGPKAAAPHHAAVAPLLADGRVLLTGSGPGASELFDSHAIAPAAPSTAPGPRAFSPIETSVMHDGATLVELDDGRVLVLGGMIDSGQDPIVLAELIDPTTMRTTRTGRLAGALDGIVTTPMPDGRVFVAGTSPGESAAAEIFDPATGEFQAVGDRLAESLRDRSPMAVSGLPDGRLVLNGGNTIQSVDVRTGALGPPAPICDYVGAAVALDADRILVGCPNEGIASIVDIATGSTEPFDVHVDGAIPIDARRIALTTGAYDYGGFGAGRIPVTQRVVSIFDTATGSVTPVADTVELGPAVVVAGDRLVSFGGNQSDPSDAAIAFDTHTWTSTQLGPMLSARANASVITLRDGRVLIVGGGHESPDRTDPLPVGAEIFDPSRIH